MPVDANIRALMKLECKWEKATGLNSHADPSYAPARTVLCYYEESVGVLGGVHAIRGPERDTYEPGFDIFFDGTDETVQSFSMDDRFTIPALAETKAKTGSQPKRMMTFYGPGGKPWVRMVAL